ncbi:MAG: hypothetical protein ACKPEA_02250, partial [Planctomycetota bacterium]
MLGVDRIVADKEEAAPAPTDVHRQLRDLGDFVHRSAYRFARFTRGQGKVIEGFVRAHAIAR